LAAKPSLLGPPNPYFHSFNYYLTAKNQKKERDKDRELLLMASGKAPMGDEGRQANPDRKATAVSCAFYL
jgi:hypothetical protein